MWSGGSGRFPTPSRLFPALRAWRSRVRSGRGQLFQCRLQGQAIAGGAEAADHPYRNIGEVGVMTKRFTLMHVGQVHFDEWDAHRQQRVT